MKADAIIYTSNTGYTAEYARILGKKTGLAVYELGEAKKALGKGKTIIYLGWLMAGTIKGYKKASKTFEIAAVCGVGMAPTGTLSNEVRKSNGIPENIPLFTLQGGFDMKKLRGIHKMMMKAMSKVLNQKISEKEKPTEDDRILLSLLKDGGSCVDEKHLGDILSWYEK